jgi:hypothetical protein
MGMTRRERLNRCYRGEETDRPAVYTRVGYPANDPTYDRLKAYMREKTELKAGFASSILESQPVIASRTEPYNADFERRVEVLETPAGPLRRTRLDSLKGQPGLHETYFINSPEEAERYLSLPMPVIGGEVSAFFKADAAIGDAGQTDVGLGFNPAGFASELCGSENFAMMSITDREILHRLCERRMAIILERLRFLLKHKVGPFFNMAGEEYLVPPLHGRKDFDDFNVRYDKPIADLIHEAGGRLHIHCHGPIREVFTGFLEIGADVLHPIEPPPLGNLEIREAKALCRGRMCLEGNIQIHRMYEATPEEVREETVRLIADAFDDRRGLIVCPSASPYIRGAGERCFPVYQAMVETVLKGGAA